MPIHTHTHLYVFCIHVSMHAIQVRIHFHDPCGIHTFRVRISTQLGIQICAHIGVVFELMFVVTLVLVLAHMLAFTSSSYVDVRSVFFMALFFVMLSILLSLLCQCSSYALCS